MNEWSFEWDTPTLVVILSVIGVLVIQLLLCTRVKRTLVRLIPVILLTLSTAVLFICSITVGGWDAFGFLFFALFSFVLLAVCGIVWGIWAIVRKKGDRDEYDLKKKNAMGKVGKALLITVSIAVVLFIGAWLFIGALWNGAFNFLLPQEIATYQSPDGEYSLVFEQMGEPEWPFGSTDVRLTLKNRKGKVIERVSTQVSNDGADATEYNIASISWNDDAVIIILRACEMNDKEISIAYHNR